MIKQIVEFYYCYGGLLSFLLNVMALIFIPIIIFKLNNNKQKLLKISEIRNQERKIITKESFKFQILITKIGLFFEKANLIKINENNYRDYYNKLQSYIQDQYIWENWVVACKNNQFVFKALDDFFIELYKKKNEMRTIVNDLISDYNTFYTKISAIQQNNTIYGYCIKFINQIGELHWLLEIYTLEGSIGISWKKMKKMVNKDKAVSVTLKNKGKIKLRH